MNPTASIEIHSDEEAPSSRRRSRRLARTLLVVAALAVVTMAVPPSAGAAGTSNVRDNGWSCAAAETGGYIHFRFPQMWRNNGRVRNEGVWVRPMVMKLVNGRWEYYAHTTAVGLTGPYGMLSTSVFGTWMKENSSMTLNFYKVPVSAGTYAVGFGYRWESTGWGSMISWRIDSPGAHTCHIPK